MGSPQTRDSAGSYHRSPLCPRKVSAFVSLLSSVISCRACGKHGHSMNVAVYFRALLGPLVHVMLPAVGDLRGPYLWPPHTETEELSDDSTEITEIKRAVCVRELGPKLILSIVQPQIGKSCARFLFEGAPGWHSR